MSERPVAVVPTRNAAEGFAALLALDPSLDAAANVDPMTEAGRAIQTVVVTEAVRDATIGGQKVKRGPDDRARPGRRPRRRRQRPRAVRPRGDDRRCRPGYELVTIFYGDGADLAETEAMAEADRPGPARARRSRSATAASRSTGTSSPPSRTTQGALDAGARRRPLPTDPVELLATPLHQSGLTAANLLRRAGVRLGLVRRPRPALPPAAALRRPARAGDARRPVGPRRRRRSCRSRPRSATSGSRRASGGASSGPSRVLADDDRARSRRPGSGGASSSGGCTPARRSSCRGRLKRFRGT